MSLEETIQTLESYGIVVELRDGEKINVAKHNDAYYVWPTDEGTLSVRQNTQQSYNRADIHWVNNHLSIRITELNTIKLYRKKPDLMGLTYETYKLPEEMLMGNK